MTRVPRAPRSLQRRLLVLVLGLVTALWLASALLTWADATHELDELLDSHLAQAAALLVVQQTRAFDDGDGDDDADGVDAPQLHRYAPRTAFQVWHEGRLAQRSSNAPPTPMTQRADARADGFETLTIAGTRWRVFSTRGAERDVQVFVGEQIDSRDDIVWALLRNTLWPLAAGLPLLALGAWWAVRRGTEPLRDLGRQLAARDAQALHPVAVRDTPAEMQPMLAALNALLARIAAMVETERRFTADAAHELRTPLAAIRAQAQVALGEHGEGSDARRRHALQATLDGCDRAARVVEQLLTLSRLDGSATLPMLPVDLAAVVRHVAAELVPRALAKRQDVEVEAESSCPLRADETLLAVLVRNLLDNAVRYSPPEARLRVTVRCDGGAGMLCVEDSGPGLADADLQRLGERFFRVLGSGQSGSGLGWSIVRRIAAVQGAAAQVQRSATLGGLAVTLRWPAA